MHEPYRSRFLAKIEHVPPPPDLPVEGDCWRWTGSKKPEGYGTFQWPKRGKTALAHRVIYEGFVGPIPDGLTLDHLCRRRDCVNPAHLEPCTSRENSMRGNVPAAINARKTHCPEGHPYDVTEADGRRRCYTCRRASDRARKQRKRESA